MSAPAITMDVGKIKVNVLSVNKNLEEIKQRLIRAITQGVVEFANDTISTAQQAAHVRTGDLRGSGTVTDPVVTDSQVSCVAGFNKQYAAQVNFGGPIYGNGKMLTIPMPDIMTGRGVPRYSSPREEQGLFVLRIFGKAYLVKKVPGRLEFHWLLKDHVWQAGDDFFSNTLADKKQSAAQMIGSRAASLMRGSI